MINREKALEILNKYVTSNSLKNHCLCVAAAMEGYAEKFNEDKDKWWVCGLLHDFDWEIHPTLEKHPLEGIKILRGLKVEEDICQAILGHGNHTGIKRETLMAKTLFAVDELSGLVLALAKVKKGFEMDADSIRKAMKKKGFAANINREEIIAGIKELGVNEEEHFLLVINSISKIKNEIGF